MRRPATRTEHDIIADFLERSGQWLTNEATHAAAMADVRNAALEEAAASADLLANTLAENRMPSAVMVREAARSIRALKSE